MNKPVWLENFHQWWVDHIPFWVTWALLFVVNYIWIYASLMWILTRIFG